MSPTIATLETWHHANETTKIDTALAEYPANLFLNFLNDYRYIPRWAAGLAAHVNPEKHSGNFTFHYATTRARHVGNCVASLCILWPHMAARFQTKFPGCQHLHQLRNWDPTQPCPLSAETIEELTHWKNTKVLKEWGLTSKLLKQPTPPSPWTLTTARQQQFSFSITPNTIVENREHYTALLKLRANHVVLFVDYRAVNAAITETKNLAKRLGLHIVDELPCYHLSTLMHHHHSLPLINTLMLSDPKPNNILSILQHIGPNDPTFLPIATAVVPLVKASELQNVQILKYSPPNSRNTSTSTTNTLIRYLVNHGVAYQPEPETIPQLL